MNESDPEHYREYLQLMGRSQLDGRLLAKVDVSGVVQVTLLEAHQQRSEWNALAESDRLPWLHRVFANNLIDEIRRFRGQKRDVSREQSMEQSINRSSLKLHEWIASEQTSPSGLASANERAVLLAKALTTLPESQATAIELHYLQGQSLKQVASFLDKTEGAVAALLFRGTRTLRQRMSDPDKED